MTEQAERVNVPFHLPVLLTEVMGRLGVRPDGVYVDATVGDGGHALAFLRESSPQGCVCGIDLDPRSLVRAERRLASYGKRFIPAPGSYASMVTLVQGILGEEVRVDGILLDLGISSRQVDGAGFGFSFQQDEPLDMRFDPEGDGPTAAEIVNTWPEGELTAAIREYGEEPRAAAVARAIVRRRPIATTGQLAQVVAAATGRNDRDSRSGRNSRNRRNYGESGTGNGDDNGNRGGGSGGASGQGNSQLHSGPHSEPPGNRSGPPAGRNQRNRGNRRTHPATRTFQALRIAVNDELNTLGVGLNQAVELLAPAGRLAVISYHSLEDRLVKTFLVREAAQCICPPGLPVCVCQHRPRLKLVNRRVIRPGPAEVAANPRSRSARLRVAERLPD